MSVRFAGRSKFSRFSLCSVLLFGVLPSAWAVRVATYNVENYNCTDRLVAGVFRKNYPKPEASKTQLRSEIRAVDADVLALQEIGGEGYARELQQDLRREGVNYPHIVVLDADDKDRKLAIFSKQPWVRAIEEKQLTFEYLDEKISVKRGLLGVVFEDADGEWAVFNVHLKGKFTDKVDDPLSAQRRLLEARAIRDAVAGQFPSEKGGRTFIVGDLNDDPKSKPVQALLKRGKRNLGYLVPTEDSRGECWTHFYHGKDIYSRMDYIIASPELKRGLKKGVPRIHDRESRSRLRWEQPTDHRLVFVDWSP